MPCTTILVGKKASYDGSTIIARNDDSGAGHFTPKKFVVVHPEEQPRKYKSVISHVEIDLPEEPCAIPHAKCAGRKGRVGGQRRERSPCGHDGDGDDHIQSPGAGC